MTASSGRSNVCNWSLESRSSPWSRSWAFSWRCGSVFMVLRWLEQALGIIGTNVVTSLWTSVAGGGMVHFLVGLYWMAQVLDITGENLDTFTSNSVAVDGMRTAPSSCSHGRHHRHVPGHAHEWFLGGRWRRTSPVARLGGDSVCASLQGLEYEIGFTGKDLVTFRSTSVAVRRDGGSLSSRTWSRS